MINDKTMFNLSDKLANVDWTVLENKDSDEAYDIIILQQVPQYI